MDAITGRNRLSPPALCFEQHLDFNAGSRTWHDKVRGRHAERLSIRVPGGTPAYRLPLRAMPPIWFDAMEECASLPDTEQDSRYSRPTHLAAFWCQRQAAQGNLCSGCRSFIVTLAGKGIGVRALASFAGHRSTTATQAYIDATDAMKQAAVELA